MGLFTIPKDYEDGYNAGYADGFDDGFDTAMLTEGEEKDIVNICLETCKYFRARKGEVTDEELTDIIKSKFRAFMEERKTGVSAIFSEVADQYSLEREEQ